MYFSAHELLVEIDEIGHIDRNLKKRKRKTNKHIKTH